MTRSRFRRYIRRAKIEALVEAQHRQDRVSLCAACKLSFMGCRPGVGLANSDKNIP